MYMYNICYINYKDKGKIQYLYMYMIFDNKHGPYLVHVNVTDCIHTKYKLIDMLNAHLLTSIDIF